jgi:ABC transport system ATP-binding/permease protein
VPEGNGRWIEYAGGYSDMLVQRGADLTREKPKQEPQQAAQEGASVAVEPPIAKRRLVFKDKHALETLPKTIAKFQAEVKELQAKLDDPQFYKRDRAGFEKVTTTLGELQLKIATAEEQWLALEMLREEVANG